MIVNDNFSNRFSVAVLCSCIGGSYFVFGLFLSLAFSSFAAYKRLHYENKPPR